MAKKYQVMWQLWDEVIEEYLMRPVTGVIHSTREAARRERAKLLEDCQYAGESFFVMEVRE